MAHLHRVLDLNMDMLLHCAFRQSRITYGQQHRPVLHFSWRFGYHYCMCHPAEYYGFWLRIFVVCLGGLEQSDWV